MAFSYQVSAIVLAFQTFKFSYITLNLICHQALIF